MAIEDWIDPFAWDYDEWEERRPAPLRGDAYKKDLDDRAKSTLAKLGQSVTRFERELQEAARSARRPKLLALIGVTHVIA